MRSRGWEDNRRTLLQYILTCEQLVRTSAYNGATGSRSQFIYELSLPTQAMIWMMWCVKVDHNTGGLRPLLFSKVAWVLLRFHKNQINKCKCYEMGPTVFRPYPRRLESLTIGRCH